MKIGILTSGGDCSGLNAVIRAIGLYADNNIKNAEIVGIPGGYGGLIRGESEPLARRDFEDILDRGVAPAVQTDDGGGKRHFAPAQNVRKL